MTLTPGLSYLLSHTLWSGLDLLFPPNCGGCGKLGSRWCTDCQKNLTRIPQPICDICGFPRNDPGICRECQTTRPAFFALRSCVVYKEPIRPALLTLKYHRPDHGLGDALAWDMAVYLDELNWHADGVVPVPLSEQRLSERGYNQVDIIARPLARLMKWPYINKGLRRSRNTRSQVGLNGKERRQNVQGAFIAEPSHVSGKALLLVDDITTTGATLRSASTSLIEAGASKVLAITIARAMKMSEHAA